MCTTGPVSDDAIQHMRHQVQDDESDHQRTEHRQWLTAPDQSRQLGSDYQP